MEIISTLPSVGESKRDTVVLLAQILQRLVMAAPKEACGRGDHHLPFGHGNASR
jgi:hypothetical protein